MSGVTATSGSSTFSDLGLTLQSNSGKKELGQQDFLALMTAQLQNQDPMNPMDNADFLGQLAQFSTVQGIQTMNDSLSNLTASLTSDQALQAASLVGHDVMVLSDTGYLPTDGNLRGGVYTSASGEVSVDVLDASGQVVDTVNLGTQPAGLVDFEWDGFNAGGERMAEGNYSLSARLTQGSTQIAVPTLVISSVNSVALNSGGLELELQGLPSVNFDDVYKIL
ncbi:flagellar hook assembly protein FlgD [Sinimarinibacterium sp. CAU 1509]|uniref:flagellar hook assembly protein FlgD n=1 Tax=Sinimarinibacterium sp. CAU 1509 TaxID=2562283 RepID=UPI0010ABA784|nr:flagellar hook assembly protein FlgD [Sinimarinibacterium sp. CAU 1509]TJY62876.1 flagellar hook assembly protein FlgD [Sinimarinibacterium sp. CAU 1509]